MRGKTGILFLYDDLFHFYFRDLLVVSYLHENTRHHYEYKTNKSTSFLQVYLLFNTTAL